MGHIWVLYGQKSLYGAHVGLEWDKCPDSAHMGLTYICLLGCCPFTESVDTTEPDDFITGWGGDCNTFSWEATL